MKQNINCGRICLEKETDAKLSKQYIVKNNLQQGKEIAVFMSQIRVCEMACYL